MWQVEKQLTAENYAADWHVVSFAKVPDKAGQVLRILHGRPDRAHRLRFVGQLATFLDLGPQEAAWDGLLSGGLVRALLDVVLDQTLWPRWFTNEILRVSSVLMHSDKIIYDTKIQEYIFAACSCISVMLVHIVIAADCQHPRKHGLGMGEPWANDVLDALHRMWTLFLEHRALLVYGYNDEGAVDDADPVQEENAVTFRHLICHLLVAHIYFSNEER